jgi:pimeloyl-ACP methyl ester carboxylesterase
MLLDIDGASLYYETVGSGIPLLCLHAFPFDGRMWREQRGLAEQTLGMALRPDRTGMLPCIQAPALVLCGAEDTVSPCDGMRQLAASIPGARFHTIARAGHLSPLEHPAAFNALVREFLKSLPAFEL